MARQKRTPSEKQRQTDPAPREHSTEAVAKRLAEQPEADPYQRFLWYYAMMNSDKDHIVTIAEANEAQLLFGKYGPYVVDCIILGPVNPLNPMGRQFPISNTDYKVLPGKNATICPRAKPQLGVKMVAQIAEGLRKRGLIKASQTIHYVGPQAQPDAICECDLVAGQAEADNPSLCARLVIDLETNSLTLNGTPYSGLDPTGLRIIHTLQQAASNGKPIVSGRVLSETVPGCKGGEKAVRRCLHRLPDAVRVLVKAKAGMGRWLELLPQK